ncbi:MAG TPA: Hint domain-containing protein [Candidatus Limnocylindria bacterium]|jgi:hypothetical protein
MNAHRPTRLWLATQASIVLALAGCAAAPSSTPSTGSTPSAQPSDSPSPGSGNLALADLKYRLIDRFGLLWYCDPDEYPVAHGDEQELAEQRLPEIRLDADTYAAITSQLGIDPQADPDPAQTLAVYRAWKMLNALILEPEDNGFRFDAIFTSALDAAEGMRVAGHIAPDGTISVEAEAVSGPPPCPICLAEGTRIATPAGEVPVEQLSVGEQVLATGGEGGVRVAVVVRIGSVEVPASHVVVRMTLTDGRSVIASPGHPLADGRPIGSIRAGDTVDGSVVRSVTRERYLGRRTYDLLTSGETGAYIANGIPLGSTLVP